MEPAHFHYKRKEQPSERGRVMEALGVDTRQGLWVPTRRISLEDIAQKYQRVQPGIGRDDALAMAQQLVEASHHYDNEVVIFRKRGAAYFFDIVMG